MFRTRPNCIPLLLARIWPCEPPKWNPWYLSYWWRHLSSCFGFWFKNCGFSLAQKWPAIAKLLQLLMFLSKIVHRCYYYQPQAKSREGNVFTGICLATVFMRTVHILLECSLVKHRIMYQPRTIRNKSNLVFPKCFQKYCHYSKRARTCHPSTSCVRDQDGKTAPQDQRQQDTLQELQ